MRVYIETLTTSSQEPQKKKSKEVENKPGVGEETIRIKEQPGNENDLEPSTTIGAGRQEATKRQLSPPDRIQTGIG